MKYIFILILIFFASQNLLAVTNYVSKTGAHISPFNSWENAATNIQAAVDAASAGDMVLVNDGIYNSGGGITPGYSCSNRVLITKNIIIKSVNGPKKTVILGAGPIGSNAVRCVFMTAGTLSGFTISNGYTQISGNSIYNQDGGGIWCTNGCVITNCTIIGNSAYYGGGGVYCREGGTVVNCVISGNNADFGGGGCCQSGGSFITCSIFSNIATVLYSGNGGGMYCSKGSSISNCVISGNSSYSGGGVYCSIGSIVSDCIINSNYASFRGGGGYCNKESIFSNCVVNSNSAYQHGGGIYCWEGGFVLNCIISNNNAGSGGGGAVCANGGSVLDCLIIDNITSSEEGGGVFCSGDGLVSKCTIISNKAERGGGIYCHFNNAVSKCILIGNSAETGGGILGMPGSSFTDCSIIGNSAEYGGGIYCYVGGEAINCLISKNYAFYDGGGGFCDGNGTIKNCLISGNSANENGGGVFCDDGGAVQNCTFSGNSAERAGGIACYNGDVQNCIIYYNYALDNPNYNGSSSAFKYNCSIPQPTGEGNISNSPKLLDSGHIAFDSPCVAVGNNAYSSGVDIDNNPWENPPAMGCDQPVTGTKTGELVVSVFAAYKETVTGASNYFTATISGEAESNSWSFGDGGTLQNDLGAYYSWINTGTYEVILTAFNETYPAGISDTVLVEVVEKQTHYVNKNNISPSAPYTSWISAATNIQDAIDEAKRTETVLVTNGIYYIIDKIIITNEIIVKSVNGAENTIIDGIHTNRCFYLNRWCVLDGFTIKNGRVNGIPSGNFGGGVYCDKNGLIKNCMINENSADYGGGIYCSGGIIQNCVINNNSADYGGGVYSTDNSTIQNCTICSNSSIHSAGGVCFNEDGTIQNCILWNNTKPEINDNFLLNQYNCLENWTELINGIITNNPQFVDAAAGNYRLDISSPCIDAGTNMSWMWSVTDLDGNPRITGGTVDMGAYEFVPEPCLFIICFVFGIVYSRRPSGPGSSLPL